MALKTVAPEIWKMPDYDSHIWRVIDANLNRANEAFRVIEDCLRFVIEDQHLTRICKNLRHHLGEWSGQFDHHDRLAMRDASDDVGRSTDVEAEYRRSDVQEILRANLARAEQSLRTLEEFSKMVNPQLAQDAEKIRYKVYELEKATLLLRQSNDHLRDARVYVLLDGCHDLARFRAKLEYLVQSGVHLIQLRDKSLGDRQLLSFGETLVQATRAGGVKSIINDRVDIALAVGADGAHLGQDDLSLKQARKIAGPNMLLGVSTHNIEQARQALMDGASYIGVGPTFSSTTKHFDEFSGVEFLQQVADELSLPAFAIGGIHLENLQLVLNTGITRIAISGAVPDELDEIAATIHEFKSRLSSMVSRNSQAAVQRSGHADPAPD